MVLIILVLREISVHHTWIHSGNSQIFSFQLNSWPMGKAEDAAMPGAHACSQVRGNAWVKGREEREGEMANV